MRLWQRRDRRSRIRKIYGSRNAVDREDVCRFFNDVQLASGVFKTTSTQRLDDLNELVLPLLPRGRTVNVMDVAISAGVTTQEWSEQLDTASISHRIVAGDSDLDALWFALPSADLLTDARGRLIYAEILGRRVRTGRGSFRSFVRIGFLRGLLRSAKLMRRAPRKIQLLVPELLENPAVTVTVDDIFNHRPEFEAGFDALRAANILNRSYFEDPQLSVAVMNLKRRLRPYGLLIICRSEANGRNNATVFRKDGESLTPIARLGDGSEVEPLVKNL